MGIILTGKKSLPAGQINRLALELIPPSSSNQDSYYMVLSKIRIKLTKPALNKPDFGPWYALVKSYLVKYSRFQPYSTQTIFRAYGSRVDAYYPSRPSTVVDQRLTHFKSVQNFKNAAIFGTSIFGLSFLTVFSRNFLVRKLTFWTSDQFNSHGKVIWKLFISS